MEPEAGMVAGCPTPRWPAGLVRTAAIASAAIGFVVLVG
jgi:hypothetical protein